MDSSKPDTIHAEQANDMLQLDEDNQMLEYENQMSLWQSAKAHRRLLLYVIPALLVGTVYGYDSVVNGASLSMPAFISFFGDTTADGTSYLPSIWTSLWNAMTGLAQAIGSFVVGIVMDRYGRKWPVVSMAILSLIGATVQYFAISRAMLLGGRIINGFAIGALLAIATAWSSEISPARLRGPVQSTIVLSQMIMQMVGLGLIRSLLAETRPRAFRIAFAVQWPLAALVVISFFFIPESPVYLIHRGRIDLARKALCTLFGKDNIIDARLSHLHRAIRHENAATHVEAGNYIDCFKGTNLRRTATVMFIFSGLNVCGAQLLTQNTYFLTMTGLPVTHAMDVGIGGMGLSLILVIASWNTMETVGRRLIFLSGPLVTAVLMAIIGALYYAPGMGPIWAVAVLMNFLIAWGVVSFMSSGWAIGAELSTYRLRAKTQSIAIITNTVCQWLFSFITPYMYNVDSGNLKARTGFVYAGLSAVYWVVTIFIVPESHGLTIEELDWMYENRIKSLDFQSKKEEARDAVARRTEQKVFM